MFRLLQPGQPEHWLQLTPSYGPVGSHAPRWLGGELRDISAARHYKAHAYHFNARKNTLLELLSLDLADCLSLAQRLSRDADESVHDFIRQCLSEGERRIVAISQGSVQLIRDFVEDEIQELVIVEMHRGTIGVARLEGQGTTVVVELPTLPE
ncbi:ATP-binding protein [Hymenobacter sp. CRA2]|uniref:ATP-binding protein n=1 Tax=Hymenobacter sp. CRA2 TaxID=1955620 RepID=UPI00098F08F2|nr:ATP-binding protein [Hymenobacter sp. CRA2]OON67663.1 hypothetical protein B0919_17735 [Hymenobacter sp. CRA2]